VVAAPNAVGDVALARGERDNLQARNSPRIGAPAGKMLRLQPDTVETRLLHFPVEERRQTVDERHARIIV
jgi:hypothetical protein